MMRETLKLSAYWNARGETPEELAVRVLTMVDALKEIDPTFDNWIWFSRRRIRRLERMRHDLAKRIAGDVVRDEDGATLPLSGYSFGIANEKGGSPRYFSVSVNAGAARPDTFAANRVIAHTSSDFAPEPIIASYEVIRSVLLVLAETWDANWCVVYPSDLAATWLPDRALDRAWITYVNPRFASLITPPPRAIVEIRANGGLVMSATTKRFVTANPEHMDAACNIEDALTPLDALWP